MQTKTILRAIIIASVMLSSLKSFAADVVAVYPITDKIICVHFDEGMVDYSGYHEYPPWGYNKSYQSPLDRTAAENKNNYTLTASDGNYNSGKSPVYVGRKAKLKDCKEPAAWGNTNALTEFVKQHWLYLELPNAIQRNVTYTLTLNNLADNMNEITFTYDEAKMRSIAVHVNQIGFTPDGPKYAYLSQWMGDFSNGVHQNGGLELDELTGTQFHIVPWDDQRISAAVYTGTISKRKEKNTSESTSNEFGPNSNYTYADVWECDFSSVTAPGEYVVVVERMGRSYPFEIDENGYRDAYYALSRGMFAQRTGIVKEMEPDVIWDRDHRLDDGYDVFYDANYKGWINTSHWTGGSSGGKPQVDILGHYHDAGDWDKYLRHNICPMEMLLAYYLKPGNFKDGDIGNRYKDKMTDATWFEEGANGIPDILDEARWTIDLLERGKQELIAKGLGTGGCPGDYIGKEGADDGFPSWEDSRGVWLVSAESPAGTWDYAGLCAFYSKCLEIAYGTSNAETQAYMTEAVGAYNWAKSYVASHGGEYNDNAKDSRAYAAAILYWLTEDAQYQTDYKATYNASFWYGNAPTNSTNRWELAGAMYAMLPANFPGLDASHHTKIKNAIIGAANQMVNPISDRGFRLGMRNNNKFSLGSHSTPKTVSMAVAYKLTGDQKYLDAIHTTASYCLGGNEMNRVHVTSLGEDYEKYLFHKDSWKCKEYNYKSMVYHTPMVPGLVGYFGNTVGWVSGAGDETWSHTSAYPDWSNWPKAEGRFDNIYSIAGSEFTVNQNMSNSLFAYGYLAGPSDGSYVPNERPTVSINISNGTDVSKNTKFRITSSASPDTRSVKYYYDYHFIGESFDKANNFAFDWDVPQSSVSVGETVLITAFPLDDKGYFARPTDDCDAEVNIVNTVTPTPPVAVAGADIYVILPTSTATLNGSASYDEGTITNYSWSQIGGPSATIQSPSSANTQISGLVKANYEFVLTVTDDDMESDKDTVMVYVSDGIDVQSVSITNCPGSLETGSSMTLVAAITPANATNKNVTWTTSDASVVSISDGDITAEAVGTATITVTTENGGFTDLCVINVLPCADPTSVSIDDCPGSIYFGDTRCFTATVSDPCGNLSTTDVVWSSSNSGILDFDASTGCINPVGEGAVTITATIDNGMTSTCDVTVSDAPSIQNLNPEEDAYLENGNLFDNDQLKVEPGRRVSYLKFNVTGISGKTVESMKLKLEVSGDAGNGTINVYEGSHSTWTEADLNTNTPGKGNLLGTLNSSYAVATEYIFDLSGITDDGYFTLILEMESGDNDAWFSSSEGVTVPVLEVVTSSSGQQYSISTSGANGSIERAPLKALYNEGETVQLTAVPDAGYEFTAWGGDASGMTNPITLTMDADKTITASFTLIPTYSLTINATNGDVAKSPDKTSYQEGETVTLMATPNTGYDFVNWTGDASGTNTTTTVTMGADKTVTANFAIKTYTVTYIAGANGSLSGDLVQTVDHWASTTAVNATPNATYNFLNWSDGRSDNPRTDVNVTSDIIVTAQFGNQNTFTLTYTAGTGGNIDGVASQTIIEGDNGSQVTAIPDAGYRFVQWNDGNTSASRTDLNVTADDTYNATFELIPTYSISITANNGSVSKSPDQADYDEGASVTLTATPDAGYRFVNWTGDASGANATASITMDADKTVTANFEPIPTYTLDITSVNGSVSKSPDKAEYVEGDVVTLTASADVNYNFANWSGDASGTNPQVSLTMDGNKSVTANFIEIVSTYTLTIISDQGSVVASPDKSSYTDGEKVTITAIPNAGFEFAGWSGDGSGTDNPLEVTMDSDKVITAGYNNITGMDDMASDITIWPNPAIDVVKISGIANYHSLKITNTLGQVVLETATGGKLQRMDVSALEKGIYFITFINERNTGMVHKIIKQ